MAHLPYLALAGARGAPMLPAETRCCPFMRRNSNAVTMLLRGANDYMLDEMDRSLHDALCVIKRVLESGTVVPGGGAVEAALSIYLESFATTLGSREQLAIAEFADALLVIPKTLAGKPMEPGPRCWLTRTGAGLLAGRLGCQRRPRRMSSVMQ